MEAQMEGEVGKGNYLWTGTLRLHIWEVQQKRKGCGCGETKDCCFLLGIGRHHNEKNKPSQEENRK